MRSLHRPARLRVAALALLALAVLGGHGLLWHALRSSAVAPAPGLAHRPTPQLVVRTIVAAPPAMPAPAAEALPRRTRPAAPAPAAEMVAAAQLPPPAAESRPLTGASELPVHATRLPDPAQLHYRLQRGGNVGVGRLQWQRVDSGYTLRLDVEWPGQPPQGSASRGQIDAEGVAPQRHAELRRTRELRAVNFQREASLITSSGPQVAYVLPPGAQDRLSWMIQLPAIVEADAALARAGAAVTLFVAGTRGDAEAWRFEVLGQENLELPAGPVPQAVHLRREPTRPYDTRVQVWLDPARQHLPVRAVFTTLPGGQPLELELASQDTGLEIGAAGPR
jgi:hypothetical protein